MDIPKDSKILVVDDDSQLLFALIRVLNKAGYSTLEAKSGDEAIRVVQENNPALILLDIVMPGMDGLEVCKNLKGNPSTSDIRIILVSGKKLSSEDISSGFIAGADDYIRRPFGQSELLARVQVQLKLRGKKKQLKTSLSKYQHIVDNSTDMIAFLDNQFRYIIVNDAYAKEFNFRPDQFVSKFASNIFGDEFFSKVIFPYGKRCLAGEEVRYQEWFMFPSTGKQYMDITYSPYIDDSGEVTGFIVSGRNITSLKQTKKSLNLLKKFHEDVIYNSPIGIAIYDSDSGQCVECNLSMSKLIGATTTKQVLSQNYRNIESWKRTGILEAAYLAISDNKVKQHKAEITNSYGKTLVIDCHIAPFSSEKHQYLMVTAVDVTRRNQAEKALEKSERTARAIINSSRESVFLIDVNGIFIDMNTTTAERLKSTRKNLIGKCAYDILPYDVAACRKAKIDKAIANREPVHFTDERFNAVVENTIYPIINDNGVVELVAVYTRDITKIKQAEAEIKTLKGIVPICSYCKNIRDDEGYWKKIEVFVSAHSEAEFSHSICDGCLEKHFPGIDLDD